jgi:hypothetical protein
VNAKPAFFDESKYLLNARLARIVNLKGTARTESKQRNGKHNTIKDWFEPGVEGAIDENPNIITDPGLICLSTPHELLARLAGFPLE